MKTQINWEAPAFKEFLRFVSKKIKHTIRGIPYVFPSPLLHLACEYFKIDVTWDTEYWNCYSNVLATYEGLDMPHDKDRDEAIRKCLKQIENKGV